MAKTPLPPLKLREWPVPRRAQASISLLLELYHPHVRVSPRLGLVEDGSDVPFQCTPGVSERPNRGPLTTTH